MSINLIAVRRNPRIWARRSNNYRQIKIEGIHKRMVRKTGCYPNWTPITTLTFYIWTVLPPNFHRSVRVLLNRVLQQRWIGRATKGDNHPLPWPPHLPDLTPYDFFLWGFVKDSVYVPPLPIPHQRTSWSDNACTADHYSGHATLSLGWIWLPCGCVSCDPGCTHWRIVINAWETGTVASADGVGCARVRWEINFLLTFEKGTILLCIPGILVYNAH